jgi:hypothetical protein
MQRKKENGLKAATRWRQGNNNICVFPKNFSLSFVGHLIQHMCWQNEAGGGKDDCLTKGGSAAPSNHNIFV